MTTGVYPPPKGYRTIRLPLSEYEYERFLTDRSYATLRLEELYEDSPHCFLTRFQGVMLFSVLPTLRFKQQLPVSSLCLNQGPIVFTVAPAFGMPYMTGRVEEVDHALFLRRFYGAYWAIAHVFGRDAMYWYRLEQGLGRFSLVGTTVKTPKRDRKTWWRMQSRAG